MKAAFLKAVNYPYGAKAMHLIRNTPIEIAIGAVVLGTAFGTVSYQVNAEKEKRIPLAFSEIEKTIKEFRAQEKPVPPLTKFYASLNDVLMKVFEANNIALESNYSHSRFASELEVKIDPALKIHRLIGEYAAEMPDDARAALLSLAKLIEANKDLPPVIAAFSKIWDASHQEVTKTKTWTEWECDSEGENCQDVPHSEQVYDYTIHSYKYDPVQGKNADQLTGSFLLKHPELNVGERLYLAKKTSIDNEYAIERSMRDALHRKMPTPVQSLMYANTWATGSNLTTYQPVITDNHAGLQKISPLWSAAKNTAESTRYNTYSRNDDGPKEYQVAQTALKHAQNINTSIHAITDGIQLAGYAVPALNAKIKEYVDVVLDSKPGNADKLRGEVLQIAKTTYQKNFENGLDVQPFKWEEVLLYTLLGLVAGGLAGAGVDRYGDRERHPSSGRRFP